MASILQQFRPMASLLPFLCPRLRPSSSSIRQFTTTTLRYAPKRKPQHSPFPRTIIGRHSILPYTFFRCERFPGVKVRDKRQMDKRKGQRPHTGIYWDVNTTKSTKGDLVYPLVDNIMEGPNGIQIRTNSEFFLKMVLRNNNKFEASGMGGNSGEGTGVVYQFKKGMVLPEEVVLIHEREDFWSLQPNVTMTLEGFQKVMNKLFKSVYFYRREEWLEKYAPEWAEYEDPEGKL